MTTISRRDVLERVRFSARTSLPNHIIISQGNHPATSSARNRTNPPQGKRKALPLPRRPAVSPLPPLPCGGACDGGSWWDRMARGNALRLPCWAEGVMGLLLLSIIFRDTVS
ncbi:MAG TPA: hypothetical protein VFB60_07060 [Ktedonobacteraceae bacterium]|nr:hypothetical protein [Ktedonobacteraceae bacterium]